MGIEMSNGNIRGGAIEDEETTISRHTSKFVLVYPLLERAKRNGITPLFYCWDRVLP